MDGDARLAQDVSDLSFLQPGGVIFERQSIEVIVHAEAPQAVGVSELPQGAELLGAKGALQFVGDFDQGHAWIIATCHQ